ncbi:MAG TPA: hypothetical protein VHC69_16680 [Polyangiaceae bacterium]|nr:hypothetical protein [Polyangiaceae bacterium]
MALQRTFIGLAIVGGALSTACGGTSHPAGKDSGVETHPGERDASTTPSPANDAGLPPARHDAGLAPPADAAIHPFDATSPEPERDAASEPERNDAAPEPERNDAASDATADATDGVVCHGAGARFATGSPAHWFGPGQNDGQDRFPAPVLGPPKGGGACSGSTDTVSLGNGGWVVVDFAGNAIVDGPGPDFIVFENPFEINCNPNNVFAELGTVGVSQDGVHFTDFPCTATMPPYGECSGWHPVYANADTNDIDPTDPAVAGGDPYDLVELGLKWARYVRVTDRPDLTGPAGVYDLDAVSIVHPACP